MKNFKKHVLILLMLFFTGCASLSQHRELNSLKCDKLAEDIFKIRSLSIESSLVSLGFSLSHNGIPSDIVIKLLEQAGSAEANSFFNEKYSDRLNSLTLDMMTKAGCSINAWIEEKEKKTDGFQLNEPNSSNQSEEKNIKKSI